MPSIIPAKGEVKHVDGIDFDRSNLSINQMRPGLFAGEWHNNHHLYPGSARAGFLRYQIDLAWIYIWILNKLGGVSSYRNSQKDFLKKYIEEGYTAKNMIPPTGRAYTSKHMHGLVPEEVPINEADSASRKPSRYRKQNRA